MSASCPSISVRGASTLARPPRGSDPTAFHPAPEQRRSSRTSRQGSARASVHHLFSGVPQMGEYPISQFPSTPCLSRYHLLTLYMISCKKAIRYQKTDETDMANYRYFADTAAGTLVFDRVDNRSQSARHNDSWGWTGSEWVKVNRVVQMKSSPSHHECDARCFNATGRTMQCECSCGGKNHGKGAFMCEAA